MNKGVCSICGKFGFGTRVGDDGVSYDIFGYVLVLFFAFEDT